MSFKNLDKGNASFVQSIPTQHQSYEQKKPVMDQYPTFLNTLKTVIAQMPLPDLSNQFTARSKI